MTDASVHDTYTSPLAARNASRAMLTLWSPRHKFQTWRRIWLAVARAQHEQGLPVSAAQIAELTEHLRVTDADLAAAAQHERTLRHDVMAHVHAWGDRCPSARGILHLGMTSQDVVCNADVLILRESTALVRAKLARAVDALGAFAAQHRALPTLGFTHYQPAQPTTVGRRAAGWAYDLAVCLDQLAARVGSIRMRGLRGATGTQASYLALFEGDAAAVDRLEAQAIEQPWGQAHLLSGQTYPRVVDAMILADLAATAAVLHKIATDIRLLSNRKELDEPFGGRQIGSSAMPYKRNPMRCERICGLTRFVMNLVGNAYDTTATQWLERTLDDSSNRRLSLPEAFLALDGALDLMHNVASGLIVNEAMVTRNLMAELPFMATENILMAAVRAGGDRQDLHERIRVHSIEAGKRVKQEGLDNDLIDRLRADPALASVRDLLTEGELLDPKQYIGRAPEQVDRFLERVVEPLRRTYADELADLDDSEPRV